MELAPSESHVPQTVETKDGVATLHRSAFPHGFIFGAATAAYQVEGAVAEGGRKPSIWDTFASLPGKIADGSNAEVACDQYHRYPEDIALMEKMHIDAYRFSISWSRIFPDGIGPEVNQEGVDHYNKLIDGLIEKGIKPFITLFHWDLPQALQDSFGGWTDRKIVKVFGDYADACFSAFGDRVRDWITMNEPFQFSFNGYGTGDHAPGRCTKNGGNSATEPYLVAHHLLLAHAEAVDRYRRKYKDEQGGQVGIALDCLWGEALSSSLENQAAAQRHIECQLAWFLDPIYFGHYPAVMLENVGDRLPRFSKDEIKLLHGSLDFIGLNQYSSRYVADGPAPPNGKESDVKGDRHVREAVMKSGKYIGDRAASVWLYVVPWGMHKLLVWMTKRYNRPPLYITENGMDEKQGESQSREEMLNDTKRIHFYQEYMSGALGAIREGADLRGYFLWSFMDNFEWNLGKANRFGLIYVDYDDNLNRHVKESGRWYSAFLNKKHGGSGFELENA